MQIDSGDNIEPRHFFVRQLKTANKPDAFTKYTDIHTEKERERAHINPYHQILLQEISEPAMETARCWTERRMHFQMKRCDWISEHIPKPTTSWCKNERKKKYNCENLNRKKSRWTKKYMSRIKIFKYLVLLVWSNKVKKKEDTENDEKCCRGKTSRQKETINNQVRRSAGARIGRHVQEWSKMKISAEYFAWLHQCRWYVWRIWTQEFLYFFMKLIRFPLTFLALVYKIGAFFFAGCSWTIAHSHENMRAFCSKVIYIMSIA